MVSRLFLHVASSGVSGTLPSGEQSSLTANLTFEANDATNHSMSRFRGTSVQTWTKSSNATTSLQNYFVGRWVSDPINQSGIAANSWTVNLACIGASGANFPAGVDPDNDIWCNIYVWRPSNGTKVGTIVDGNIPSTSMGGTANGTSLDVYIASISGSAVAGAAAGDVIIFEFWTTTTQSSASSLTIKFMQDGTVVNTVSLSGPVTNHASFIQTPENISFQDTYVEVKLYLHNTTTGIPTGTLPSAEQSTKTVTTNCNFEGSQTTNRLMDVNIGSSQASLALATPASVSASTFYVSRWVSPVINQTSVAAGSWIYNFAAKESNTSANFPVTSNNKAVWINCYVWKPSNGTKYGTILDGNTAATVSEGAANTEKSQQAEFTGAAVTSLTSGDAIIVLEVWFAITQGSATSYTDTFYYDGTTETAGGSTVSNHASYIMTQGMDLVFTSSTNFDRPITESSISVGGGTLARVYGANRSPSAGSITVNGGTLSRVVTNARTISAGAVTVAGGTLSRIYNAIRAVSAGSVTVNGGTLARVVSNSRTIVESSISVAGGTLSRIKNAIRGINEPVINSNGGFVTTVKGFPRTINEPSITVSGGTLSRVLGLFRNIPSSVTVAGGTLTRAVTNTRSLIEGAISIVGNVAAAKVYPRNIPSSVTVAGGTLSRAVTNTRNITEPSITVNGGVLSRIKSAFRSIPESVSVAAGTVNRAITNNRTISESGITVGLGSVSRVLSIFRSINQSINIASGTLTRAVQNSRTLTESAISIGAGSVVAGIITLREITESAISVGPGTLTRVIQNSRIIPDAVNVGVGVCNRAVQLNRTIAAGAIAIGSGIVTRAFAFNRNISEANIAVGSSVTRVYHAARNVIESSINVAAGSVTRSVENSRIIPDTVNVGNGIATRLVGFGRQIIESTVSISDSVSNAFSQLVVKDFIPRLLTDFTMDVGKLIKNWIKDNYSIGDPPKEDE